MSQTITQQVDDYLAVQSMPANDLIIDPKWHNIRMVTPIGRFAYVHVEAPHAIPSQDGSPPRPMYSATLLMAAGTDDKPIVADLWRAACLVADTHWPAIQRPDPTNASNIVTVPGSHLFFVDQKLGGLHFPLRRGDDNYMKEPQKFALWRGLYFINCGMSPKTKAGADQRPVTLDESGMACDPKIFYPGCYGRMQITVSPFEVKGNRGVSFFLNAVQFARHGERMASFDAGGAARSAFAKAGAIAGDVGTPPVGFGTNTASPAQAPSGLPVGTPYGFAPPPAAGTGQPAAGAAFAAPNPNAAPAGRPRPPGV